MANWRDLNRKALGDVHRQFQLPAVYISHAGGVPIRLHVRLHRKTDQANGYSEFEFGMAGNTTSLSDAIIFEASTVQGVALNSGHVIFSDNEGYNTGASWPERRGFIRVEVSAMSKVELIRLLNAVDQNLPEWVGILPQAPLE